MNKQTFMKELKDLKVGPGIRFEYGDIEYYVANMPIDYYIENMTTGGIDWYEKQSEVIEHIYGKGE